MNIFTTTLKIPQPISYRISIVTSFQSEEIDTHKLWNFITKSWSFKMSLILTNGFYIEHFLSDLSRHFYLIFSGNRIFFDGLLKSNFSFFRVWNRRIMLEIDMFVVSPDYDYNLEYAFGGIFCFCFCRYMSGIILKIIENGPLSL